MSIYSPDHVYKQFIPALVGKPVSDVERALFTLPVRLGGLGISNPQALSDSEFAASVRATYPLVDSIIHQKSTLNADITACQCQAKTAIVAVKRELQSAKTSELKSILPADLLQFCHMPLRLVLLPG